MQCNLQLGQSELTEGKPACMYWRSVPISDYAVTRLQPALPPMEAGSGQHFPAYTSENAASVWAMEGYFMVCLLPQATSLYAKPWLHFWHTAASSARLKPRGCSVVKCCVLQFPDAHFPLVRLAFLIIECCMQDDENRWSMGPIYSMQNMHLLTHMFIHEYASTIDPQQPLSFSEQPMKEARPMYDYSSWHCCLQTVSTCCSAAPMSSLAHLLAACVVLGKPADSTYGEHSHFMA